jgi:hypothetical protein
MSTATPANTSLGSIGLGYIYVDTLAQMDYSIPTFYGLDATIGIFDPINDGTDNVTPAGVTQTPTQKKAPGFHGKISYTYKFDSATKLYLSSAFIDQSQGYIRSDTGLAYTYNGFGIDAFAMMDWYNLEGFLYYYHGSGLGTTGLFFLSDDGLGDKRGSNGYLAQVTYKVISRLKLGVNYGSSRLGFANAADAADNPTLVASNNKVTGGAYYSLTKNLTLLGEVSDVRAKAHDDGTNHSVNFNVGAYLSF